MSFPYSERKQRHGVEPCFCELGDEDDCAHHEDDDICNLMPALSHGIASRTVSAQACQAKKMKKAMAMIPFIAIPPSFVRFLNLTDLLATAQDNFTYEAIKKFDCVGG